MIFQEKNFVHLKKTKISSGAISFELSIYNINLSNAVERHKYENLPTFSLIMIREKIIKRITQKEMQCNSITCKFMKFSHFAHSPSITDLKVISSDVFIFLQGLSFLNCSLTQEVDS